ncbi:CDC3 [Cyberlindnera jadinii]|uniref:CDC3 protein n=1 Tax=Cyberlindnera jadinii (strain ATCC 18201 / CBS 1600 / BCRC 20928 / JCM 3617 / NBRC 0987 / NRRL Y-1542) TaxID=983966 RepID=A0A0H5C806_CYBJN|nr:Septin-domain-containing protein [Cyberlindnera jadinii NRRL Y-1542]ODV71377.1 Septin-domain-containing protein [Cyberlindnera jadinii NRRL Y-1542]CEP24318.1 CDC3 [Cyberlindnera jadinii]
MSASNSMYKVSSLVDPPAAVNSNTNGVKIEEGEEQHQQQQQGSAATTSTANTNDNGVTPSHIGTGIIKGEYDEDGDVVTSPLKSEHGTTGAFSSSSGGVGSTAAKSQVNIIPDVKIIKRKLNGYVGFANLPKQWHRKSIRNGFNLNLLVVGEAGLGKSTLINTLFNRELIGPQPPRDPAEERPSSVTIHTVESDIEENGVKLHLTVVNTPGFGEQINNTQAWQPIIDEVNSRFDSYLEYENKVSRSGYIDSRIHACLYFIEPTGHSLKPLDIEFLKAIHKKVNIIPVIAKSDTLTEQEVEEFKQRINDDIKFQGIEIFEPKLYNDDDEETTQAYHNLISRLPFAIVGSTTEIQTPDGRTVRGRQYPWGVIEVDNEDHNDFVKLRQLVIRNFMEELREKTSNVLYENYRSEKLLRLGITQDDSVFREFDPTVKQQEEKALHEAKLAKLEAEMKQIFQQKVAEKEKKLQKSEAELFSRHKEVKEKLLKQVKQLEEKKKQLQTARLNPTMHDPQPLPTQKAKKGFLGR